MLWIRSRIGKADPDPGGENDPRKIEKEEEI